MAWGECAWHGVGGMHGKGACVAAGVCAWQGACMPCTAPNWTLRDTVGQCAAGTHPTGMHSCLHVKNLMWKLKHFATDRKGAWGR